MSIIPYVIEQTSREERSYDIYSRLHLYVALNDGEKYVLKEFEKTEILLA